jgi:hypothetical protein
MLPETHPLIEAATKPLADNAEQRLAAYALLWENFNPDDPGVGDSLERFAKVDSKRFPRGWRIALHVCAGLSICLMLFSIRSIRSVMPGFSGISRMGSYEEPKLKLPDALTPDQKLLLGDPNLPELRQKELLHLSDPGRADFYTEYAGKFASKYDKLPEDYLETTARIDPDNSFHLYNVAGRESADSFERVKAKKTKPPRYSGTTKLREIPDEAVWKINDEAEFNKALDLVAKASQLPRYDSYETSMAAARLPFFNQDRMIPRIRTIAYFAGQTTQVISIRRTADLIAAKAYFLSLEGDKEAFLKLYADSEAFLAHFARSPESNLIGELVYAVNGAATAHAFHFGAERLGLTELAEKVQVRRVAFIDDANARALREDPMSDRFEHEGSMLAGLIGPSLGKQVANPPPLDPEILTPGRLADHDLCSSIVMPIVVLLLGLSALATFVCRSLLPRPVKAVSRRLDLLLRPIDWAWVACAVIVPIAATLSVTRYASLGGRDFNLRHSQFLFPTLHFWLIIFLLLTVPAAVVRWRLGKRLSSFGMHGGFRVASLILPAAGGLALLFAHPVIERFSIERVSPAMMALAVFPGLWGASILFGFVSMYFGKKDQRILRATALGALPPALSFAMIVLAPLAPMFRESAEKWVAKDDFTRVVVNGFNSYEAEIARQKRKETNAILGFE